MRGQLSREQTLTLKWSLAPSLPTLSATSCAVPVWLPYSTSSGRSAEPISGIRGRRAGGKYGRVKGSKYGGVEGDKYGSTITTREVFR